MPDEAVFCEDPAGRTLSHLAPSLSRPLTDQAAWVESDRLSRETARVGIGSIFAQANAAGLEIDVFELITAVFATEDPDFSLIDDWSRVHARLQRHAALRDIDRTGFLSAVALLTTFHKGDLVGGQREDFLNLHVEDRRMAVPQLLDGFDEAADFLLQRCIFDRSTVPYRTQLIPLTVIFAVLGETPEALSRM